MQYEIKSSNPMLLQKAKITAQKYAEKQITNNIIGIVFLGAIVRGYYDEEADIDIAIFQKSTEQDFETRTIEVDGFQLQYFKLNFENEKHITWEMGKRWAYSNIEIFFDPENKVYQLIHEKVQLMDQERKQLLMVGIALSEWYINRLTELWITRGNIMSAHYMINEGLNHFYTVLFMLNNQLVADFKWRIFCAEQLKILPADFKEKISRVMETKEITKNELEMRKSAFMELWHDILPKVEDEVGMKYEDFRDTI